jgi:hypothetical protein
MATSAKLVSILRDKSGSARADPDTLRMRSELVAGVSGGFRKKR